MCGRQKLIDYLQKICGYLLSGETKEKKFFMLYGEKTNNGKSTFISILNNIFGDYAEKLNPSSIIETRYNNQGAASPDIAKLNGTRLVTISELPENAKLDNTRLKIFSGGSDGIVARHLNEEEFNLEIQFKLVIALNNKSR